MAALPRPTANFQKGQVTIEDEEEDDYEYDEVDEMGGVPGSTSPAGGPDNTNRGGLSPGTESAFEVWMRHNVNEPLLAHLPEWVTPNSISFVNTAICWLSFVFGYAAYKYEHLYPIGAFTLRLTMAALVFIGITLDCLDGMQARKTGRCSKLGEVLDHSLDAANVPLIACCVIWTVFPDDWTVLIGLIGGFMIYNAQLVIYRHHHVFVLPPVTGPAAQALASGSLVIFGFFFLAFSRHSYFGSMVITIFAIVGNLVQFQNCYFYARRCTETACVVPHSRFMVVMTLHGTMLVAGIITKPEYLLSAVVLCYRLNGKYVLDTLQSFKPFTSTHTKEIVRQQDSAWQWDCIIGIVGLHLLAALTGVAQAQATDSLTGLPFISDSVFHLAFYAAMAACVGGNALDLVRAAPALSSK